MGFEKESLVKTFEKSEVMGLQIATLKPFDYRRNSFILLTHWFTLKAKPVFPKSFVRRPP